MKAQSAYAKGMGMELRARQYLQRQGLVFKQANFRVKGGEIDLIMQDMDTLVFVEVRYRQSAAYGSAKASITLRKQARVRKAAKLYLQRYYKQLPACRFDAVCIEGEQPHIQWIKSAF